MCGIYAVIYTAGQCPIPSATLQRRLQNRGPDHLGTVTTGLGGNDAISLSFTSTVLSLRGDHVTKQPLVDDTTGSVLCWNGEAWELDRQTVQGNDSEAVLSLLSVASHRSLKDDGRGVLDALRGIRGPFSFIYFDKPAKRLYYGRDRLGRRSLLVQPGSPFLLASISDSLNSGWSEVEADGIYTLQFSHEAVALEDLVHAKHDWVENTSLVSGIGAFNSSIPLEPFHLTSQSGVVAQLRQLLTESLQLRVLQVPIPPKASSTDARIAVLFSGGLDCTVLARLASHVLPPDQPIDLINVAFENPRLAAQNKGASQDELFASCPDRITARKSFAELLAVCPSRKWRLVVVNVPFSLATEHRAEVIDLMHPHNTEMDLSIAFALYFAARGSGLGQTRLVTQPEPYESTARVLISGLGADELFGGYVRHQKAFNLRGHAGLVDELRLDLKRLGKRNLGRDDRVMATWKREVRFPYLDESLVKWAMELPVSHKCGFTNDGVDDSCNGTPEPGKRVLRLLAEELGMNVVAREKKRAIQFGARTAKMENGKVKGTTLICP
ncbi:asparagine synthetase domain containing protein 1 [Metarhizium album ARSEF 1941]|uniref:Asparagine synthetase domain containing protein 1 n=1 Tax=Metarhizium album (strain ARSEF 1941) TaxID=1081103 RepID=A0A0B2WV31_METAS|nr:asparagine synthetase domain containing protein 1 [Metarhizium album ARSEF 1941]KHN99966.1 asparagine synthetase domain containing protein 1 [Metarhizium album ARSEF 1941]